MVIGSVAGGPCVSWGTRPIGSALLEIWLVLNRRRRGPLDLWEVPKPSVPPVAEAASASGSETVLVLVALITTKSAVNEQYTNFFFKTTNVSHT